MGIIDFETRLGLERLHEAWEVADQEDFSTLIIDSSLDGIIVCDSHECITVWNKAMERMSGLPKEEVLGGNAFELFPFLKEQGMDKAFEEAMQGKTVKCPQISFKIASTGVEGYSEQTNSPIYDEMGKIFGVLIVVRDVTETRLVIDELQAKNRALEERLRGYENGRSR